MSTKAQRTRNDVGSFRGDWAALWLVALILATLILSYLAVYFAGTRSGFWYTARDDWQKNVRPTLAEGSEESPVDHSERL